MKVNLKSGKRKIQRIRNNTKRKNIKVMLKLIKAKTNFRESQLARATKIKSILLIRRIRNMESKNSISVSVSLKSMRIIRIQKI
jgi:hypothetical protein